MMAERDCDTCKHENARFDLYPCDGCGREERWEEKDEPKIKDLETENASFRAAVELTEKAHELCIAERMKLQEEADRFRATLERVQSVGHNLDCLFCGFKDKEVIKALKGE